MARCDGGDEVAKMQEGGKVKKEGQGVVGSARRSVDESRLESAYNSRYPGPLCSVCPAVGQPCSGPAIRQSHMIGAAVVEGSERFCRSAFPMLFGPYIGEPSTRPQSSRDPRAPNWKENVLRASGGIRSTEILYTGDKLGDRMMAFGVIREIPYL